ncbi:MAG: M23 family metallopeptidase [Spirochaetaceae bacterium]|jgi:murein DD-endopeptidase MepM/ murein hydrolase activator NlpD|nr:M23 family metallopeptidase [Spirochaetaceae bacterium]
MKKRPLFYIKRQKNYFPALLPETPPIFSRNGPNAVRILLAGAIFSYFPLVSVHLKPLFSNALTNASLTLHSVFFPHKAGMGGMETPDENLDGFYAETAGFILEGTEEGLGAEVFSTPAPLIFFAHQLERGDIIGDLSIKYGLNEDTLFSVNGVKNSRTIQAGKPLKIPNQDGVMYTAKAGENVTEIAGKYGVEAGQIIAANELFSEKITISANLFIPGARMTDEEKREINGDFFIWPIRGRITSRYGWRISPITGKRSFHSGLDIAAPQGVPVGAGMAGRVTAASYSAVFGNYVIISHHANYRTLYGHLHSIRTRVGAYVSTGQTIGTVGNTGQSTGPHLHFQVYKNGATVNPLTTMN